MIFTDMELREEEYRKVREVIIPEDNIPSPISTQDPSGYGSDSSTASSRECNNRLEESPKELRASGTASSAFSIDSILGRSNVDEDLQENEREEQDIRSNFARPVALSASHSTVTRKPFSLPNLRTVFQDGEFNRISDNRLTGLTPTTVYPVAGLQTYPETNIPDPNGYSAASLASASLLYSGWFAQSKPGQLFGLQGKSNIIFTSSFKNEKSKNHPSIIDRVKLPYNFLIELKVYHETRYTFAPRLRGGTQNHSSKVLMVFSRVRSPLPVHPGSSGPISLRCYPEKEKKGIEINDIKNVRKEKKRTNFENLYSFFFLFFFPFYIRRKRSKRFQSHARETLAPRLSTMVS